MNLWAGWRPAQHRLQGKSAEISTERRGGLRSIVVAKGDKFYEGVSVGMLPSWTDDHSVALAATLNRARPRVNRLTALLREGERVKRQVVKGRSRTANGGGQCRRMRGLMVEAGPWTLMLGVPPLAVHSSLLLLSHEDSAREAASPFRASAFHKQRSRMWP